MKNSLVFINFKFQKGCSIALIISDVIGNPVELIASGPTVIPAHQQDKFIISNILESLKINKLELPVNVKNVLENHEKGGYQYSNCNEIL